MCGLQSHIVVPDDTFGGYTRVFIVPAQFWYCFSFTASGLGERRPAVFGVGGPEGIVEGEGQQGLQETCLIWLVAVHAVCFTVSGLLPYERSLFSIAFCFAFFGAF